MTNASLEKSLRLLRRHYCFSTVFSSSPLPLHHSRWLRQYACWSVLSVSLIHGGANARERRGGKLPSSSVLVAIVTGIYLGESHCVSEAVVVFLSPLPSEYIPFTLPSFPVALLLFVTRTPFVSFCFPNDEHKRDARYWKLNPDRTVPTLQDADLTLNTPNAILKYLATSRNEISSFLSKDLKKRSSQLSALDWDLFVLRKTEKDLSLSIDYNRPQLVDDYWGTNSGNGGAHTSKPNGVLSSIARLESIWLPKGRFSCGSHTANISDFALWADYTYLVNVFKLQSQFPAEKYPLLTGWDAKMRALYSENESAKELVRTYESILKRLAEQKPEMPKKPADLELSWKDYK